MVLWLKESRKHLRTRALPDKTFWWTTISVGWFIDSDSNFERDLSPIFLGFQWPLFEQKQENIRRRSLWSLFIIHLFSFTMFQRGEINYKCLKICMKLNEFTRGIQLSARGGATVVGGELLDVSLKNLMMRQIEEHKNTWVAHQIERPAVGCLWPASTGLHPLGVDCPTRKPIAIRPEPLTFF